MLGAIVYRIDRAARGVHVEAIQPRGKPTSAFEASAVMGIGAGLWPGPN